jgi:hypothetical protein
MIALLNLLPLALAGIASATPVRGDTASVAVAERLLEQVGGRSAWATRTLIVEERGYLRSGEVAQLTITRDFVRNARVIERVTPSGRLVEWVSPESGWVNRNGTVSAISAAELAIEVQGLRQEPYAIYHRLARRDAALRVELREEGRTLHVYDRGEHLLCWFNLDARGGLIGWGNFYDGSINQHWYGPLADMGDVNLPRFGAQSTGNFRFEYVRARMSSEASIEPGAQGAAAPQGGPAKPLQPFAWLAGSCWKGTFPGQSSTDEHCFEWVFDGERTLRDRHTVRGARAPYAGETIYYWDARTSRVSYLYVASDGSHSVGTATVEDGALVFPESYVSDQGRRELKSIWRRTGDDSYEVRSVQVSPGPERELWSMTMRRQPR